MAYTSIEHHCTVADVSYWLWSHSWSLQEQTRREKRACPFCLDVGLCLRHKTRQRTGRQELCEVRDLLWYFVEKVMS